MARLLNSLLVGSFLVCSAQSPTDGHVDGPAYINTYLHFAYAWPHMLHPVDVTLLNLHAARPNPGEFPLFAAQQDHKAIGVVILAEKLHVPTQHNPAGFMDGADFLGRIEPSWPPEAHFKVLGILHTTTPDGFTLDELDYSVLNEFDSGITIEIGQYLVVFKCKAESASALSIMTKSILAIRRTR